MDKKNSINSFRFKIGEFSKLCRVTVKTLRHYEAISLLTPNEIDEWTGYRYYNVSQSQKMATIQHLKRLGFSLEEISDIFSTGSDRPDIDRIEKKLEECRDEIEKLKHRATELSCLSEQIKSKTNMDKIFIKTIPSRIVASHRQIIKSYDELFNLCPNILGPEMMRIGCTCHEPQYCYTVEHNKEHCDSNIDLEYCEAVGEWHEDTPLLHFYESAELKNAVCMNHIGSYERFGETFAELLKYLEENDIHITGSPRFCYIDGIWNKESEDEWLTEIQVPVE